MELGFSSNDCHSLCLETNWFWGGPFENLELILLSEWWPSGFWPYLTLLMSALFIITTTPSHKKVNQKDPWMCDDVRRCCGDWFAICQPLTRWGNPYVVTRSIQDGHLRAHMMKFYHPIVLFSPLPFRNCQNWMELFLSWLERFAVLIWPIISSQARWNSEFSSARSFAYH